MGLHPKFPKSPYEILDPEVRWLPADESLRDTSMDKLMPPLVVNLRKKVKEFRDNDYIGASDTSRSLLKWWFLEKHLVDGIGGIPQEFRYFFAQREALETVIYLHDVVKAENKYDLMRFDSSGLITEDKFDESWLRMVIKMATGTGKTKVMSLALAWSYFHKQYEPESKLARNFLVIAPNIIVLDRIYKDFEGLKIFNQDPIIPDNGYDGKHWQHDWNMTIHKQDEVHATQPVGNIFLTNIQRVYVGKDHIPSANDENTMDYFLGQRPVGSTIDSKIDLGIIVREVNELMIINDEAHHIHDSKLAWFKSIQDIHNNLLQNNSSLSLQLDVTATPRHINGGIFVQTISDYPLVEAIHQNVVKHPVLPDIPSREKLHEKQSGKYVERFADYINLGVIEWRKVYEEHTKLGKKAILFVMTDDTRNCDDVAEYLNTISDLENAVLTIHTKNNGDITEASTGKAKEELDKLRKDSNEIDTDVSPYKAIVSVLMLKEGWDVKNVTTIVGLRAYTSKSNILPEQTLGRGLRKMYFGLNEEYVSVIGTQAFMDFIETIKSEGVELERKAMGEGSESKAPLLVEVDRNNASKNLDELDIEIPILTPTLYREYKNLSELDVANFGNDKIGFKTYTSEELKVIVFKELTTDEISHETYLDSAGIADYRSVIAWFVRSIMKDLRLFSGYDVLYEKVQDFIHFKLFQKTVDLEDPNTIRNLSEPNVSNIIFSSFKQAINALTIQAKGDAELRNYIKLRNTKSFIVNDQDSITSKKSVFNRVVGDSKLERDFAALLERFPDIISYSKNYFALNFKLDYVNAKGNISNYYPDFIVKVNKELVYIIETKGFVDEDVPFQLERLKNWCLDVNNIQKKIKFDFLYIDEDNFRKYESRFQKFSDFYDLFTEYKS
ncbi:MAG: DEAD/DEAH box helicase family protein [Clostridiales Family XIII bacterium]|jgi:type III restriction enzyme|nr:DEAD/DEAH box helicase family protein [Clostridiales Family XIII bacterium]